MTKFIKQLDKFAICSLEKDVGPCMASLWRYHFNKQTGKCEEFIYGGCLGNKNNFQSMEECNRTCSNLEIAKEPEQSSEIKLSINFINIILVLIF